MLLICASFVNVLLFSLHRTGTIRAHSCCFLLLIKFMIITRHEVPLVYFRQTGFFHTILGFQTWNIRSDKLSQSNLFPALSNKYLNDCWYNPVLCPNKLVYRQRINLLKKRLILTPYDSLDWDRCLGVLLAYRVGPRTIRFLRTNWGRLTMAARASGYFGIPFKVYHGVTQGDTPSPTIFNVVVYAIICYLVMVLAPTDDGTYGLGLLIQYLAA